MKSRLKIIKSENELDQLINHCLSTGYCSFDFETTSTEFYNKDDYPAILGVSFQIGSAWVIPLGHKDSPFRDIYPRILRRFSRHVLENREVVKIGWNTKFETKWLFRYGCDLRGRVFDGMLAKHLLDEERPHNLKDMVRRFLPEFYGYEDEIEDLVKKHTWAGVPLKELSKYCGLDCDLSFRLMLHFEKRLIKNDFYRLFRSMYMPRSYVLAQCEYRGILVDREYLDGLMKSYEEKIANKNTELLSVKKVKRFQDKTKKANTDKLIQGIRDEISDIMEKNPPNAATLIKNRQNKIARIISGDLTKKEDYTGVNFRSPQQLSQLLYTSEFGFRLDIPKFTTDKWGKETNNPSTDEEALKVLQKADTTGFVANLLELRTLEKLYSTYIKGIYNLIDEENRVHTNFHLWGTVTGRLSSTQPNLQNIPRDTTAADIKKMFIPPPGCVLLELDYSQAELRIVAEWANEPTMLEWFRIGRNIHVASACRANKCEDRYDEILKITKDESHPEHVFWTKRKKRAKTINFGILYEQSPMKLKETLEADGESVSLSEAEEYMKNWFEDFPRIKRFIERQHKFVKKHGYVKTMFGQKRRLPDIYSSNYGDMLRAQRQSSNTPVQGTAAQFGTFAAVIVDQQIKSGYIKGIVQEVYNVHDSTGFYVKPEYIHDIIPKLFAIYQNPDTRRYFDFELKRVVMQANAEVGKNWGELAGYKDTIDYSTLINT